MKSKRMEHDKMNKEQSADESSDLILRYKKYN